MINKDLKNYIVDNIIPIYDNFDKGHDKIHVTNVINIGVLLAKHRSLEKYNIDENIVYAICACHDIGLIKGRINHGFESANMVMSDSFIRKFFNSKKLKIITEAIEDHRSVYIGKRRSIYGKILAEADMEGAFDINRGVERLWKYRISHMPNSTNKEKLDDMMQHIKVLYAKNGKFYKTELNIPLRIDTLNRVAKIITNREEVAKILVKLNLIEEILL